MPDPPLPSASHLLQSLDEVLPKLNHAESIIDSQILKGDPLPEETINNLHWMTEKILNAGNLRFSNTAHGKISLQQKHKPSFEILAGFFAVFSRERSNSNLLRLFRAVTNVVEFDNSPNGSDSRIRLAKGGKLVFGSLLSVNPENWRRESARDSLHPLIRSLVASVANTLVCELLVSNPGTKSTIKKTINGYDWKSIETKTPTSQLHSLITTFLSSDKSSELGNYPTLEAFKIELSEFFDHLDDAKLLFNKVSAVLLN